VTESITALASRHESKTLRPFVGVDDAANLMDKVRLIVDGEEHKPGTIVLSDEVLSDATLTLNLPEFEALRAAVEQGGRAHVDCAFIILARSHSHRISQALYHEVLRKADLPETFTPDRSDPKNNLILNDQEGFTLIAAVYLYRDLHPQPLQPHRAGTWLARSDFKVERERSVSSFSPLPLTKERRLELDLPPQTPSFVDVQDTLLDADQVSDAVTVYYDDVLLHTLYANPKDPLVLQLQRDLAAHTMTVIAQAAIAKIRQEKQGAPIAPEDLNQYSGVKLFFNNLATQQNVEVQQVLDRAEEPDRLRAHIADAFRLRDAVWASLAEAGDSEE
jgi:hypothetical protein